MRDPKRIPTILKGLQRLWEKYPDQRLGQLLENYVFGCGCIFHQEDDVTEEKIKGELCK